MRRILIKIRDKIFGVDKVAYLFKKESENQIRRSEFNKRELKAFEILRPFFPEGFVFETSYSMSFQAIQHILNDIVIYKPKVILEFGSGLSTLVLGNFITQRNLETRLISIDDNYLWQKSLIDQGATADFYCFPLKDNHPHSYQGKGKWFGIPEDHPVSKCQFDLVIVDAPKGSLSEMSRIGFVPFVIDNISRNSIVYLDDTNRQDEEQISRDFLAKLKYPMTVQKYYKYSRFSSDQGFITSPS